MVHPSVSRRHAMLTVAKAEGGGTRLSLTPVSLVTKVNAARPGKSPMFLKDGDCVRFGFDEQDAVSGAFRARAWVFDPPRQSAAARSILSGAF